MERLGALSRLGPTAASKMRRARERIVSAEWKAVREGNELASYPGAATHIPPLESETAASAAHCDGT